MQRHQADFLVFLSMVKIIDGIELKLIIIQLYKDEKAHENSSPEVSIDVGVCTVQGRRPYQEDQFAVGILF